ncbi:MAG: alkaline phosphatase family protein [Steroidobacteraceae bacterium]
MSTVAGAAEGRRRLDIFAFVDALGWEVLRGRTFLEDELPWRQRVRSVLGYSSACVPSILTGRMPRDHGHWSFFYCSPGTSPFGGLRPLRLLPGAITGRARVRNLLSKVVARRHGYTGYFQLYQLPFEHAHEFDYCEKRDLFSPGGVSGAPTIFDWLRDRQVPFHVSDWRRREDENVAALHRDIDARDLRFAFLYLADLDGALHELGKDDPAITGRIARYEALLGNLLVAARRRYGEVRLNVISDHGMAHVTRTFDLQSVISALPLRFGRDYVAALDSTMARFWLRSEAAARLLPEALAGAEGGRLLDDDELAALGCDFAGRRYGDLIFLMDPGHLIVPSHMGLTPIRGMHGYHPDHPDSDAALLSTHEPACPTGSICDFHGLMTLAVAA